MFLSFEILEQYWTAAYVLAPLQNVIFSEDNS